MRDTVNFTADTAEKYRDEYRNFLGSNAPHGIGDAPASLHVVADRNSPRLDKGATMNDITQRNGRTLRHLRRRCQQRGVRKHDLDMLLDWADRIVPVGGGRVAITLTRQRAALLRAKGIAAGLIDRARKRALVVNAEGDLITVVIPSGRRGRHYRRDARRRRRARRR